MSKPTQTQETRFYASLHRKDPIYKSLFPQTTRHSPDYTGKARLDECVLRNADIFVGYDMHRDSIVRLMQTLAVREVKRAMSEMRYSDDIVEVLKSNGLIFEVRK
jgi:hypothetical protein